MPKPFDSVFKDLLERDPAGWVRLAIGPVDAPMTLVDSDISVVSGASDKVVRVGGPKPLVVHFEAFASWDPTILPRSVHYNAAHHRRHNLPVDTVLVVLRPEADHPSLTGVYVVQSPTSGRRHVLEYGVLRVWKLDLAQVLSGPLATLPLAPLADEASTQLPAVLRRMGERLTAEATPEEQRDLWTDVFVLLGLRYRREAVAQLFRGIPGMRESDTYRAILEEGIDLGREEGREEGRVEEARKSLLLAGRIRLGEPDERIRALVESETDRSKLERWLEEVLRVESWEDVSGLKAEEGR